MPLICLSFVLGALIALYSISATDSLWIGYLPLLVVFAFLLPAYRLLFIFFIGFLWAVLQVNSIEKQHQPFQVAHDSLIVDGIIAEIPTQFERSQRFYLEPYASQPHFSQYPDLLRLSWYQKSVRLKAGQHWRFVVKLKPPHGFQNPGGFDYEKWLYSKGIAATGYVRSSSLNQLLQEPSSFDLNHWRSQLIDQLNNACKDCEFIGLLKALLTGYRGEISDSQQQLLQTTGTAHLLAISGLHIGMVAGFVYWIAGFGWRRLFYRSGFNRMEFSAAFSLLAAFAYAAMAGFSLPTVRALIMLSVIMLSLLMRKRVNLLNSLSIAVIIIVALDVRSLLASSFWMSVCAVLIIAFAQFRLRRVKGNIKKFVLIQIYFSLLLLPLGLLIFDQISLTGFFANLIAIPLLSMAILPVLMVAIIVLPLSQFLSSYVLQLANLLIDWLLLYLSSLNHPALTANSPGNLSTAVVLLGLLGVIIFSLPLSLRKKIGAATLIVIPFLWRPDPIPQGEFRAHVLDVGMGTSVVVQTARHNLVYDFGPGRKSGFNAGDWVVKPFLKSKNIGSPDMMIISHADQDHSGGFYAFVTDNDDSRLLTGTVKETGSRFDLQQPLQSCHRFPSWQWDDVSFEFLATEQSQHDSSTNNRSCVLKISGIHQLLLAGDIEVEQESNLIHVFGDKLQSDVLLAPHHGSLTSSSQPFVEKVRSSQVIFTSGFLNRWGFPMAEVVERYNQAQSQVFRTDHDGSITIKSTETGLLFETMRASLYRRWHSAN